MSIDAPTISNPENRNADPSQRFAGLGGRIKPDGTYPTPEEWLAHPAHLDDLIFQDYKDVETFFKPEIDEIDNIIESSTADRESIINQISTLTPRHRDLVRRVVANTFPLSTEGDTEYDARSNKDADPPEPTFEFTILTEGHKKYPKALFNFIKINDHIIEGLAKPYAITARFVATASFPWVSGTTKDDGELAVSVVLGSKDYQSTPTATGRLYTCADPEAIQQTLAFCKELTADIFASPDAD